MAYIEYRRFTDLKSLAQDSAVEVTDVLYVPIFDDFEDLSVILGDPNKPGAIAGYIDGGECKLATYNGDGTWSPVGSGSSSPTYTQDQNVPNTGAASYLNTTYPDAKVGDQVYSIGTTQRRTWTCYAPGAWSRIDETLES